MLKLRPYKACDARIITSWIKSEFTFRQWCADRYDAYPITAEMLNAYYDRERDNDSVWGMTAFDEQGVAGHFTMRFPGETRREVRIGFVIVDNSRRGRGCGRELMSLAIKYAFDFLGVDKISLGVFANNAAAIRCYRASGFQEAPLNPPESCLCMGERWPCIKMEINRRS